VARAVARYNSGVRATIIAICLAAAIPAAAQDLDRDGISDRLEQALLDRFTPTLLLARGECDVAPASFVPFLKEPRLSAKDGTLYGQAFSVDSNDGAARIELHYFHLWSRDCGRLGHDLDAEHVSAIVSAPRRDAPASSWIAEAWYAAAHEGSACDASSGAQARVIAAEANGPRVFISKGKHASYFDRGQCKWGCGGDECGEDRTIVPRTVINIGERNAPLSGAQWIHSTRWRLDRKMSSDFDPALRARLDGDHVIALMQHLRGPQAPVLAGDTALDGLVTAGTQTKGALARARQAVARFALRMLQ
jgi:hypothetical protein